MMSMVAHGTQLTPLTLSTNQKERGGKYILECEGPKQDGKRECPLLSPVPPSATGAVARCGSSELRWPCVGDERLHPTAGVRSATWTDRGMGRK